MKIDSHQGPRLSVAPAEGGAPRLRAADTDTDTQRQDGVTALRHAGAAQYSAQDIDVQRVNQLRQLISDGRFEIDTDRIADGLISEVRSFMQE